MKTSNRDLVVKRVEELGFTLGCYTSNIDKVSKKELNKVIKALDEDYTDINIQIRGKKYVVEICTVDREKDLILLSQEEYIDRYGCEEEEE